MSEHTSPSERIPRPVRHPARIRRFLAALVCLLWSGCTYSPAGPPNVILIVLDTTRADHLSLYGYPRETTPNLAAFAEEAIRYDRAYSTSSWTLAAHASLFTGLLPVTHQATQENLRLDEEIDTIAELLAGIGYETVAFTNNPWISESTRLSQGFERVVPLWRNRPAEPPEPVQHPTNLAVLNWITRRDAERPYLLFVNYMEPHWPYSAPSAYRERFADAHVPERARKRAGFPVTLWYMRGRRAPPAVLRARESLYDAEIAYLDATLGALFDALRRHTDLDAALVVVTADHGENLGERGHQGHSFTLYDSTLRIPLLVRLPGGASAGEVRGEPVQLTDVFATIAAATGIDGTDERVTGLNLLGPAVPADRPIVGEYYHPVTFLGRFPKTKAADKAVTPFKRRIRSIQIGSDKLIWGSDGKHELYETARDPTETEDLIESEPERARVLQVRLDEIVDRLARPISEAQRPPSEMDEATRAQLRALDYVP